MKGVDLKILIYFLNEIDIREAPFSGFGVSTFSFFGALTFI